MRPRGLRVMREHLARTALSIADGVGVRSFRSRCATRSIAAAHGPAHTAPYPDTGQHTGHHPVTTAIAAGAVRITGHIAPIADRPIGDWRISTISPNA